jgi:ATP-dependent protease Clp ATPase subunit
MIRLPSSSWICDFCGKRDTEVRKIIVGNRPDGQGAKICNECLSLCMSIMKIASGSKRKSKRSRLATLVAQDGFCRIPQPKE